MKTLLKLLLLFGVIVYLIFAFVSFSGRENDMVCRKVNYVISDSATAGFITPEEADRLLRHSGEYPLGRTMQQIDGRRIEQVLTRNHFIESVQCYKSPNGVVNVLIEQRLPLLRIMAENGDDYFLDSKGRTMTPQGYVSDLVVATGHIDRRYAGTALLKVGAYLRNNPFWDSQIEQIYVHPNHHIDMVTRVGGHIIHFGEADSIATKFQNLMAFYQKVLPKVGWNKYAEISVEHVAQIVGKKAKTKD